MAAVVEYVKFAHLALGPSKEDSKPGWMKAEWDSPTG